MKQITLKAAGLTTLAWSGETVVDTVNAGTKYHLDGQIHRSQRYHFGYLFDRSILSDDGRFAVIYVNLGTKALLLKDGEIHRELNRPYYHADAYEYPIAFWNSPTGTTYLIHCPLEYCRIDFEEVETGKIVTDIPGRKPIDFFHSRFVISPDGKTMISQGWHWHPFDFLHQYDLLACLEDPHLLDQFKERPDVDGEICAASFITNELVLLGSPEGTEAFDPEPSGNLKPGQIAVWNLQQNTVYQPVTPAVATGSYLTAINDHLAWDFFEYPKVIDFQTGLVVESWLEIVSSQQKSSILIGLENLPLIAFAANKRRVAIGIEGCIHVLEIEA